MKSLSLLSAFALTAVTGKVYLEEQFSSNPFDRWIVSKAKSDLVLVLFFADEKENLGLQTSQDARFYAISTALDEPINSADKDLVLQFSVKFEQDIDCGGGYIKLLNDLDPEKFDGSSPYNVMFGPDVCGSDRKVHVIISYKGDNKLTKRYVSVPNDVLTHQYTLIIHPDKKYKVLVDNEEKLSGNLLEDWDFLPPKEIDDPEDKKPDNWVEEEYIVDSEDKKPEDWVDGPATIPDPEAQKPEDWNDEDDGSWEVPVIPNPEYKGEWKPKEIKNPDYKGEWKPKKIPNPEYKEDDTIGQFTSSHVGFDLWQVKSGTIFDNILVTDDVEYAKQFSQDHYVAFKEAEEKVKEEKDKKEEEAEEAKRKAEEEASAKEKAAEDAEKSAEEKDEDSEDLKEDEEDEL
ncbi:hypothetical protein DSO57_1022980 [Entomophthora muscae]|uniref:Uncharacterized protein n=1 Tax=Entomophthora muscae TaxID=34485 RepID=A0ACC2SFW3_9FUNG|nr:hypothetical protein DSO57_1022980 [Entomophthora muscae]